MSIIIVTDDQEYNPLALEPYLSFNKKFEDKADSLDGALIKISIANQKMGFADGFSVDYFYSDDILLTFFLSGISEIKNIEKDYVIHHSIEYDFDMASLDIQQGMAEEFKKRADYFYIPGAKQVALSYLLAARHVQLIFDVVTSESNIQAVCNQLISHDIAMFSRGW